MKLQSEMYEMGMLMDFYGALLTENTLEVMELYYNEDYSLSEIAAMLGITRQAVSDSLRHSRAILQETEEKLGLAGRMEALRTVLEELRGRTDGDAAALAEKALGLIDGEELTGGDLYGI